MLATMATLCLMIDPAAAEFAKLQIDWVADSGRVRDLESVLPRGQAELIRLLGDNRHLVRSLARDELARRGEAAHDALCWGMRAKDPHIAHECLLLRERLFVCQLCEGDGVCPGCLEIAAPSSCPLKCDWDRHCGRCDGTGDVRYLRTTGYDDWGQWFEWRKPRDFFGGGKPR